MFVSLFIGYFFLLLIQSLHSATPCVYDLGNGHQLDIRPFGNSHKKTPKYDNIPNSNPVPHVFSWNGCFDYSKSDGGSCTNAAACYTDTKLNQSTLIAKQSDATLEHHDDVNYLIYHHDNMVLTVSLICRDVDGEVVTGRQDNAQTFEIFIISRCSCPGKCQYSGDSGSIGGGAIFLIILFALLFVYIVGGMIFLKVSRGATGPDIIPNRLLWLNILSYITDGLRYCIQVIRHRSFSVEYQKT